MEVASTTTPPVVATTTTAPAATETTKLEAPKDEPENLEAKVSAAAAEPESDYDSAEESYNSDEQQEKHHKKSVSDSENDDHHDDDNNDDDDEEEDDDDGSVGIERESGDGQESLPIKKVDDDEDKKNPQYIPKRGTFYEHDDRTADDQEDTPEVDAEKPEKESKKKVWQDKKERWSHDRFNDAEQAPKSRAELVAIYGYDIRNEDGPPRARRRRRYGRGPNKYTRKWEDEDAYSKPPTARVTKKQSPRKPRRDGEEYPSLPRDNIRDGENDRSNVTVLDRSRETNGNLNAPSSSSYNNGSSGNSYNPNNNIVNNREPSQHQSQPQQQYQEYGNRNQQQSRVGSGRVVKPKKEIKDSDYKGFTSKTRQIRNIKTEQKIVPRQQKNDDYVQSQNFTNKNSTSSLDNEMSKLSIDPSSSSSTAAGSSRHQGGGGGGGGGSGNKHQGGGSRQGSVPPRLQNEQQKGSKRYSSIRQRSLPEATTPPFNQHSNYYSNDYNQQPAPHLNHPSNTSLPPQALPPIPQVPVTATPILQAAPQFGPPFPQAPPPYMQPSVAPPFIPQQTPQLLNYVPGQPQFTQGYQGYQQQFNPVQTQPDSMYPPPTGITYYSTDQQVSQRALPPQKRPKAAIPIVAPPAPGVTATAAAASGITAATDSNNKNNKGGNQIDDNGEIHEQIVENSNLQKSDSVPK